MAKKRHAAGEKFGSWELVSFLGSGGNGEVWRAQGPDATGALKLLHPNRINKTDFERFKAEVKVLKRLAEDPGVLPIHDSHLPPNLSKQDVPWMVTEVATTLTKAIKKGTDLERVVEAFAAYARTMARVHARDIAHRDLKPDNLFLLDERWVIGDFGLTTFPGKKALTGRRKLGPMFYIAPEMLNDAASADGRAADVYSLAHCLWVMATGQSYPLPGQLRSDEPLVRLDIHVPHPRAAHLVGTLHDATAISPANRITMESLATQLEAWLNLEVAKEESDLSDLAGRIRAATEQDRAGREGEKARDAHAERILNALRSGSAVVDEELADKFQGLFRNWSGSKENPTILNSCAAEERWPDDKGTTYHGRVSIVNSGRRILWSGFGVQVRPDRTARAVAGYAMRVDSDLPRSIWAVSRAFRVETPEEETAVAELSSGMKANLRTVAQTFVSALEDQDATEG